MRRLGGLIGHKRPLSVDMGYFNPTGRKEQAVLCVCVCVCVCVCMWCVSARRAAVHVCLCSSTQCVHVISVRAEEEGRKRDYLNEVQVAEPGLGAALPLALRVGVVELPWQLLG